MNLSEAYEYVLPFGKHRGDTLREVADGHVTYLDWLLGEVEKEAPDNARRADLLVALTLVCEDRSNEIERGIESDEA